MIKQSLCIHVKNNFRHGNQATILYARWYHGIKRRELKKGRKSRSMDVGFKLRYFSTTGGHPRLTPFSMPWFLRWLGPHQSVTNTKDSISHRGSRRARPAGNGSSPPPSMHRLVFYPLALHVTMAPPEGGNMRVYRIVSPRIPPVSSPLVWSG